MRYELFYLVGVSKELDLEKIKSDVDEIVTVHSGVFEEKATQEKRKMAYKIKKDTHGIYIAKRFSTEMPENVPEIINKLNLHPGVLRFIISDATELPELKTKEERLEQEEKRGAVEKMRQEKKEAEDLEKNPPKKEATKIIPKTEDAVALNKKLEEILNI
ncbi:MAG: 30S ribosomal protein S6 [Candidatus Moraniibacteriota bacterium]